MHAVVSLCSDCLSYVVFDPQALGSRESTEYSIDIADREVENAALIKYEVEDEGPATIHIYIDEAPPESPAASPVGLVDGHLKVPSGSLYIDGSGVLEEGSSTPASQLSIDPGLYHVTAYEQHWDPAVTRAAYRTAVGFAGLWSSRVAMVLAAITWLTTLFLPLLLLFIYGWPAMLLAIAALIPCWLALVLADRIPLLRRATEAEDQLAVDFPAIVICLNRIGTSVSPEPLVGVVFGFNTSDSDLAARGTNQ